MSSPAGALRDRLALWISFGVCAAAILWTSEGVAPWDGDLHADHEAAGRAAAGACAAAGVDLLSYPIWTWHWAHPRDSRVPWDRAVRVPLSDDARRRKQVAIDCFASQLRPRSTQRPAVLPPEVVAHFIRDQEVLIS